MDILRLNGSQRAILALAELNANASIPSFRKQIKLREHSIRYQLDNFQAQGLIRKRAFINVYPLGFQDHAIYFSLSANSESDKRKLIAYLTQSHMVSWVSQLGGDYQYGFSVCARRLSEVVTFLDELSAKFPDAFFDKALSVRVSLTYFGRKYLSTAVTTSNALSFGDTKKQVKLDALDHRILHSLEHEPITSERELARRLQSPHTTIAHRLRQLSSDGVIIGYVFDINSARVGMQRFNLLVFSKGFNAKFSSELKQFAAKHPNIIYFIRCLGNWDFELGVEVTEGKAVSSIIEDLYGRFGSKLNTVKILPHFGNLKLSNYPFAKPV